MALRKRKLQSSAGRNQRTGADAGSFSSCFANVPDVHPSVFVKIVGDRPKKQYLG